MINRRISIFAKPLPPVSRACINLTIRRRRFFCDLRGGFQLSPKFRTQWRVWDPDLRVKRISEIDGSPALVSIRSFLISCRMRFSILSAVSEHGLSTSPKTYIIHRISAVKIATIFSTRLNRICSLYLKSRATAVLAYFCRLLRTQEVNARSEYIPFHER